MSEGRWRRPWASIERAQGRGVLDVFLAKSMRSIGAATAGSRRQVVTDAQGHFQGSALVITWHLRVPMSAADFAAARFVV